VPELLLQLALLRDQVINYGLEYADPCLKYFDARLEIALALLKLLDAAIVLCPCLSPQLRDPCTRRRHTLLEDSAPLAGSVR
jgi:hypothetical protein